MIISIPKHRLKKLRKKDKENASTLERTQGLGEFFIQFCPSELFNYPLWQKLSREIKNDGSIARDYPSADGNMLLIFLFANYLNDLPEKILHLKTMKEVNNGLIS